MLSAEADAALANDCIGRGPYPPRNLVEDVMTDVMGTTSVEQRSEYLARINRVMDYIDQNIDRKLTLDELSREACFSPYHFHRVFHTMVGETLGRFIQRVRVEKAATLLVGNPARSITDIALDCGFSGSAAFARAFRETFRMSASQWRSGGYEEFTKDGQQPIDDARRALEERTGEDVLSFEVDAVTNIPRWKVAMKGKDEVISVEVKTMPALNVAYVRHIGQYQGMAEVFTDLFKRLMLWAQPRDLVRPPTTQVLSVYHDDPNITIDAKLRVDACISVPEGTSAHGEVGTMVVPGGRFAVGRFELGEQEYGQAWSTIMAGWLPDSGYQPDDRLCYELFHNDCSTHPERKAIVDICVPVRPL